MDVKSLQSVVDFNDSLPASKVVAKSRLRFNNLFDASLRGIEIVCGSPSHAMNLFHMVNSQRKAGL